MFGSFMMIIGIGCISLVSYNLGKLNGFDEWEKEFGNDIFREYKEDEKHVS